MSARAGAWIAACPVAALSAFAVAQPVFDLLGRNPTFFVAHHAAPADIVLFALVVSFAPVLLTLLLVAAFGLLGRAHWGLLAAVAVLVAVVVLPPLHRVGGSPGWGFVVGALAIGGLAAIAYARMAAIRSFFTLLGVAAIAFPLLFLFHSPVARLLGAEDSATLRGTGVRSTAPIVFVLFDALSLASLLDESGGIDAVPLSGVRTTCDDRHVVPRHDDGVRRHPARRPCNSDRPVSAGSGPRSGGSRLSADALHAPRRRLRHERPRDDHGDLSEVAVRRRRARAAARQTPSNARRRGDRVRAFSPADGSRRGASIHRGEVARLPGPGAASRGGRLRAEDAGRDGSRSRGAVRALPPGPGAPAAADATLPSQPASAHAVRVPPHGARVRRARGLWGLILGRWTRDGVAADLAEHRYLLQVGFADRLLGRVLDRLEATRMLDSTLLVVTADHGAAFLPGLPHRTLTDGNQEDVVAVPLFIKEPGQHQPMLRDQPVQTIDVLPTLAAVLGIDVPWHVDGRSALSGSGPEDRMFVRQSGKMVHVRCCPDGLKETVARRIARFGARTGWPTTFTGGVHGDLVGRPADPLVTVQSAPYQVELTGGTARNVDETEGDHARRA